MSRLLPIGNLINKVRHAYVTRMSRVCHTYVTLGDRLPIRNLIIKVRHAVRHAVRHTVRHAVRHTLNDDDAITLQASTLPNYDDNSARVYVT